VFIGSPRNEESWTYKSIRILEEKIGALTPATFEYIFVEKLKLPFCDGCLGCVNTGEHACPEFATIGPLAEKMDKADGLILGSPIHTFNITGLMKNFVEFFMYKRNRPSFFGKKALVTATASGGGHTVVLDFLEQTANAWGCDVVGRIGISSSQMLKPRYLQHVDEVATEVADTFVKEIRKGELGSPKFRHLMNFRAMQNMTLNQKDSVNFRYWQERNWLDAEYYTKVPISFFARLMAGYVAGKMRSSVRKGNQRPYR
jgi:multimeric flavodoxin WrbA